MGKGEGKSLEITLKLLLSLRNRQALAGRGFYAQSAIPNYQQHREASAVTVGIQLMHTDWPSRARNG